MAIYFIQQVDNPTGHIKIGFSVDPEKRLYAIQKMSPVELRIICTIDGGCKREAALHQLFAPYRVYGEWFEASEEKTT